MRVQRVLEVVRNKSRLLEGPTWVEMAEGQAS